MTRNQLAEAEQRRTYGLALSSARVAVRLTQRELDGLGWQHLDLDAGTLTIARQLDKASATTPSDPLLYGPTKTAQTRTFALGPETLDALRLHKQTQAEVKMRSRTTYVDFGLIFAKEALDLQRPTAALGQPIKTLGGSRFVRLVRQAGVPRITFHGLRHTCATLLLAAGEPVHVVSARLGHASATMTWGTYAHAMPGMQQQAATTLSRLLHAHG
jgi:integrase